MKTPAFPCLPLSHGDARAATWCCGCRSCWRTSFELGTFPEVAGAQTGPLPPTSRSVASHGWLEIGPWREYSLEGNHQTLQIRAFSFSPAPTPPHPAKHLLQHTTGNIPLKKREREKPSAEPAACAIPVFSVPPSPHSRSSWREMGAKHMWATPPPSKGRLSTPSHRCGPSLGHLVAVGCRLSQRPPRAGSFLIFTSACLWAHF